MIMSQGFDLSHLPLPRCILIFCCHHSSIDDLLSSIIQDMQGSKVLSDEAVGMYERAITGLMKRSMLLNFAYADFEEVILILPFVSYKWP